MQKAIFRQSLLCAALALCATASQAAWVTIGDVASNGNGSVTLTNASGIAANADDGALKLNRSGHEPLAAGFDLEHAIGLSAGALDKSDVAMATEGSAVRSSFTVSAGQMLSFDWLFSTRDTGMDYAFILIAGVLTTLSDAASATQAGSGNYLTQTGVQHFSYKFTQGGVFDIALGVVDVGDYAYSSALTFQNLSVAQAVPEPGSMALMLAGLGILGWRARRS